MQATSAHDRPPGRRSEKRELILDAADRCFYRHGITASGVDTIAAEANVSKRTLYNHFPSKDELVLAYIERADERWQARLDRWLDGLDDPVERVLAYFDAYFDRPDDDEFRGCSHINAAAETTDADSPVLARLQAQKRHTRDELRAFAVEAGVGDPDLVADTLSLLLEGAIAVYGVHRDRSGVEVAKRAAAHALEHGAMVR